MVPAGVVPAGISLFSMALSLPPHARADIRTSPDPDPDPDPWPGLRVGRAAGPGVARESVQIGLRM